jgi:hypothetical protein
VNARLRADFTERTVAVIEIKFEVLGVRRPFAVLAIDLVADEKIKQSVAVDVGPGRGVRRIIVEQPRFRGDVGESAVAIVVE